MAKRNNEKERQSGSNRFRSFAFSQKGAFAGNRNSERAITGERISPLDNLQQVAQFKLDRASALLAKDAAIHNFQLVFANASEADQRMAFQEARRQWSGDYSRNVNLDPRILPLVMVLLMLWIMLTSCTTAPEVNAAPAATRTSEATAAPTEAGSTNLPPAESSSSTPPPAEAASPLPPPTETASPVPTVTETESPAESYKRVGIEKYYENPLTKEDLEPGGKVDQFFESVRAEMLAQIDWDKIDADNVEWATVSGAFTPLPADNDQPRYTNPEANAFNRDWNAFGEIVDGENRYIFMPVILYDTDDRTIHFVKAAYPLQADGVPLDQETIKRRIETWLHEMNVTPLSFGAAPDFAEQADPLFLQHLDPATQELINSILRPIVVNVHRDGDLISTVDGIKHIIWMVKIVYSKEANWYR